MNFLSHFHLAWPDEGLMIGGLEGDYYKGPLRGDLAPDLERGIKLHRSIDAYTDSHPILLELKRELPRHLRRYAGILIDLSFDHFLCLHWSRFSEMTQSEFNSRVYRTLLAREAELSDGSRNMLARLIEYDILHLYNDWSTVTASAERIGERLRGANPFLGIDKSLSPYREELESAFLTFYPELQKYCQNRLLEKTL